jgi:hypothetical protein
MRNLIPWNRSRDVSMRSGEDHPFLTLHCEMNRLFDDAFRGFVLQRLGRIPSLTESAATGRTLK